MIAIAPMEAADIAEIVAAFASLGWSGKDRGLYERYLREQTLGLRAVLIARWEEAFSGYATILWRSTYQPFADANIPEISDLNVLPQFRRRRIATRLLDEAEPLIAPRSPVAGIGVGLHVDYGPAQRLYVRRGYVPDARGLTSRGNWVSYGDHLKADDSLVLWFAKPLA